MKKEQPHFFVTKVIFFFAIIFFNLKISNAQDFHSNYSVIVSPLHNKNAIGLQSYAYGVWNEEWLIIGGRKDGLHERQPFAAFDEQGRHHLIQVYNVLKDKSWNVNLDEISKRDSNTNFLSQDIVDQLKSSNMQFAQYKNYLILIGGYGLNAAGYHVTFDRVIVINIPKLIQAIKSNKSYSQYIKSYQQDKIFEVCGGRAAVIGDRLYLVGGHSFMGSYNPDGPDSGPGFVQRYTDAVRTFDITNQAGNFIKLELINEQKDSILLHKRDFNLLPFFNNVKMKTELMAVSGVFRPDVDIPWLHNTVINQNGNILAVNSRKYFNQYHCATLSSFDKATNQNIQYYFGGISQYDIENDILTNDYNVPFTAQISLWSNEINGEWKEYITSQKLPALIGSGAEFIPYRQKDYYKDGILQIHKLPNRKELIGYIYGGIISDSNNIFWVNDGSQSRGSNTIYAVYIDSKVKQEWKKNIQSDDAFYFEVYPYVGSEVLVIDYFLSKNINAISYKITSENGTIIYEESLNNKVKGQYQEKIKIKGIAEGATLLVNFLVDGKSFLQKIKIDK